VALGEFMRVNSVLTSIGRDGLNLKNNSLGDEGWGAVISGVCASKVSKISAIDVSCESIGPAGAKVIGEAFRTSVNGVLTSLNLWHNSIGDEGAEAIGDALRVNGVLTSLDLYDNRFGVEGGKAIAAALRVNSVLTLLNLRFNQIGDEGAKAIADALRVNGALTEVCSLSQQVLTARPPITNHFFGALAGGPPTK
jgi:Ran GTPase-activating protein (RanGAP) involved in mRNA processing and transport